VTGLGAVTPIGNTVPEYWDGLKNGRNGVGPITRFDTEKFDAKIAAELKNFDATRFLDAKEARRMDIFTQYGMVAGDEAVRDSGLDLTREDMKRIGVVVGSGIGGMTVYHVEHKKLIEKGPGRVSPFFIPMMIPDILPGHLSIRYGMQGPNYSSVSACASGSHAIGLGLLHIERGDADVMLVGGSEAVITEMAVAGFCSAKALSTRNGDPAHASRPFDLNRDGFVMGEGSGIVVLEEMAHAKKRGARIYAELAGFGFTGDANHITAPHPEGIGAIQAMQLAMKDAELRIEDVDYINAHGTSTPLGDKIESMAIQTVFGPHAGSLWVSSTKSMIGHLLGASGAVEFIATVLTLKHGLVPPTINLETPDQDCSLDYVPNQAKERAVRTALSNSFGFGGHNVCLCVKRFQE
jgi:3-oxoacyl-[acyl-carrier-protein] synthase II